MSHESFSIEELQRILLDIDEEALLELGDGQRYSVVIVGGCALLLSQLTKRSMTRDIDALKVDDAIEFIVGRHLEVNTQVSVYADRLPGGFEDRLVRIPLATRTVDYWRPSNEDLAVMKLYSWRKQDRDDLLNEGMLSSLDRNRLEERVLDARGSCNAPLLYKQMVETYEKDFLPQARKLARRKKMPGWGQRL